MTEPSSQRPAKVTREQQKAETQRGKDFRAAFRRGARAAGWGFADDTAFRQCGDWYVSLSSSLLWQRGALARLAIKPMGLDPVFWEIAGLGGNETQPLSFRSTGTWTLQPPSIDDRVGLDMADVERLAGKVLDWGRRQETERLREISIASMLATLPSEHRLGGRLRAMAICLHILLDDLAGARRLCGVARPDLLPGMREDGGFIMVHPDGSAATFTDLARDWTARKLSEVSG